MSAGQRVMPTTSNGWPKGERKKLADIQDCNFRKVPEWIVAIDYGTTHCSVFVARYPGQAQNEILTMVELDEKKHRTRVPNCVLFNPYGKLIKFGYGTREVYLKQSNEMRPTFAYFEHVKRTFQRNSVSIYLLVFNFMNIPIELVYSKPMHA